MGQGSTTISVTLKPAACDWLVPVGEGWIMFISFVYLEVYISVCLGTEALPTIAAVDST